MLVSYVLLTHERTFRYTFVVVLYFPWVYRFKLKGFS